MKNQQSQFSLSFTISNIYKYLFNYQFKSLYQKGFGTIIAIMISLFYIFVLPEYLFPYYAIYYRLFSSNKVFFFVTTIGQGYLQLITINIFFYFIYISKIQFFEQDRISPERPWLWESDPQKWNILRNKLIKNLLFSNLIVIPLSTLFEIYTKGACLKIRFDVNSFPSSWEILRQIIFAMVCEDFFFYWGHRFLHLKFIYPYIHKFHHEYNYPISLSAEYCHPIEFVISNLIPTISGFLILGKQAHFITFQLWIFMKFFETSDGHSGYEFKWSPFRLFPFSGSATYHNYHHSHNDGNYSSVFIFWDIIQGTNKSYVKFLNKKGNDQIFFNKNL